MGRDGGRHLVDSILPPPSHFHDLPPRYEKHINIKIKQKALESRNKIKTETKLSGFLM